MTPPFVNEQTPLADEQRDALESMLERGHMTGVTTVYWALIDAMGGGAPTKDQVAKWMRERPEIQKSRMVKKVEGKKNSGGPIIPPAVVMSYIAADTLFIPAAFHTDKKVYKAAILYHMCVDKIRVRVTMQLTEQRSPNVDHCSAGVRRVHLSSS